MECLGARAGRPVDDKFVIDDDMDSDTFTESNLSVNRTPSHVTFSSVCAHV